MVSIKDYDSANRFLLNKFLPWRNEKYTFLAESSYITLLYGINLDTIFCNRLERIVANKNTISVNGHIIQILPR
ncbi:MAG: hypothetical protein V2A53_02700 [bacterium]